MSTAAGEGAEAPAPRVVFRVSPLVVLVGLVLAVCVTPVAVGAPYLWLIYLLPIAVIVRDLRVAHRGRRRGPDRAPDRRRSARTVVTDQLAAAWPQGSARPHPGQRDADRR